MATTRYNPPDPRRQVGSPRPSRSRDNKDTLCRNVYIYGHCRYEDTCSFNHDQNKNPSSTDVTTKKALNVESPSFTPASLQPQAPQQPQSSQQQQQQAPGKKPTFSTQALSAPVFTPRGPGSATPVQAPAPKQQPQQQQYQQTEAEQPAFNPAAIREFTPSTQPSQNGASSDSTNPYDSFSMSAVNQAMPSTQYNPYANDQNSLGGSTAPFFSGQSGFAAPAQPLQYHHYAPVGPFRDDLQPYQKLTHSFFMEEKLREEYFKKAQAAHQVLPNSLQLDNYHSLVALDTTGRKVSTLFGYVSWVYKATSFKNGRLYCLRRLEGYRLTNEHAIRSVKEWKRIDNGNIVTVHDAFTTRAFQDSGSLVFALDYHPLSKTLAEHHFPTIPTHRYRSSPNIHENVLWSYIVQISNALKAIHDANLAARCIDLSKIIITDKHRIRLSGCGVLDVLRFDARRPLAELQQEDFLHFGKAIMSLATNTLPAQLTNLSAALEQVARVYSPEMKEMLTWLINPPQPNSARNVQNLVSGISHHFVKAFDTSLHTSDALNSELYREVENGRLARLLMKLGSVNERGEYDGDPAWSEHGERYPLKLFRDYVFHRVDDQGQPHVDMGHILRALNRLDTGSQELIRLTSRDGETDFIISYKELKQALNAAFNDLFKNKRQNRVGI